MNNIRAKEIFILCLILFSGVLFSILIYKRNLDAEYKAKEHFVDQESNNFIDYLKTRLLENQYILNTFKGLFIASNEVEYLEWTRFYSSLEMIQQFPGIKMIGIVQPVKNAQRENFISTVQKDNRPDFTIWPAGERPSYYPITFIAPDFYEKWLGFDLGENTERRELLQRAAQERKVVAAEDFIKELPNKSSRYLFLKAIFINAGQQKNLFGWVLELLDFEILIDKAATTMHLPPINIYLYEGDQLDEQHLVSSRVISTSQGETFYSRGVLEFGEKKWTFLFTSDATLGPDATDKLLGPSLSLIATLLICGIVFLYFLERGKKEVLKAISEKEKDHSLAIQGAILQAVEYSVISTDLAGTIVSFNPKAEKMLGYTAEEMIGKKTPLEFHDPYEISQKAKEISTLLGTPVSPTFEVFLVPAQRDLVLEHEWTYIRKDHSRFPVFLSVTPVKDKRGKLIGLVGIAEDISQRKESRKIKEEFFSLLLKESVLPFQKIQTLLDCLAKRVDLHEEEKQEITEAEKSSRYLLEFLNLLKVNLEIEEEKIPFTFMRTDFTALFDNTIKVMSLLTEKKQQKLKVSSLKESCFVQADEKWLKIAIVKLIENGIMHNPENFPLIISLEKKTNRIHLEVCDHRKEISREKRLEVFRKLPSEVEADKNTQLGLCLSKMIVEKHGGIVGFESTEEHTLFWFELPIID